MYYKSRNNNNIIDTMSDKRKNRKTLNLEDDSSKARKCLEK